MLLQPLPILKAPFTDISVITQFLTIFILIIIIIILFTEKDKK
jgi:hypothetical protein